MERPSVAPEALILSGGVAHDFPASSAELAAVLAEAGFTPRIEQEVDQALAGLADGAVEGAARPLLVLNMLRWTMQVERYAHLRQQWSISLSPGARAGLIQHLADGGGLLAMHGASICFDDWPQWRDLLGGVWRWDRSSHPPLDGAVPVRVVTGSHPIVADVGDFRIVDEVYGFLDRTPDVTGLLFSAHGGEDHPLLWARAVGRGRVVYDALGHHVASYAVPEHRLIVRRAAAWASGAPADQVAVGMLG